MPVFNWVHLSFMKYYTKGNVLGPEIFLLEEQNYTMLSPDIDFHKATILVWFLPYTNR